MSEVIELGTRKYEVVRELTRHGRRARVYLIRLPSGQLGVLKQALPGFERFVHREISAIQNLANVDKYNVLPELVEADFGYMITKYYDDRPALKGRYFGLALNLIPLHVLASVFRSLESFYGHGYEIFDVHPENVLVTDNGSVKIIDLEFAYPGAAQIGVPFVKSQTISGPHPDWSDDLPRGAIEYAGEWYLRTWYYRSGLSVTSILNDRPLLQRAKRLAFLPRRYAMSAIVRTRRLARRFYKRIKNARGRQS